MPIKVSWQQALAWRLARQYLVPIGDADVGVVDVVRRLIGVQAQVASSAELAVRLRHQPSESGEVAVALTEGRLIKTWAMRGTLHLLTPEEGGAALSLIAAGKSWHLPSWQRYFGMTIVQMDRLREQIRETLHGRALTREELIAELTRRPDLGHAADALRSGWGTLLKPAAWQGDLVFGPSRGTRVTFTTPETASPSWAGVPDPDEAGPIVAARYLAAYGPATLDNFRAWLARPARRQLKQWFAAADAVEVEVDGEQAYIRAEDIDELAHMQPTESVRLLGGFDQWVLGPGTGDARVIAPNRRASVSRQSGWISPIVVVGGVVRGTWELDRDTVKVAWFGEGRRPPAQGITEEVGRLAAVLGRSLEVEIAAGYL